MVKLEAMAERGRPTKYTDELAVAICEAIASGVPEVIAAQAAGLDKSTLTSWKKSKPDFLAQVKEARAQAVQVRIKRIEKAAKGGEDVDVSDRTIKHKDGKLERIVTRKKTYPTWQADAWWLERQFVEEFGLNRIELKELLGLLRDMKGRKK